MPSVRDLVDDATRARLEEEAEEAARPLLPERHHDVVANCPAALLPDLAANHLELADEIVRRRSKDVMQL